MSKARSPSASRRLTVEESLNLITRLSGYRYEKFDNTYVVGTEESLKAFRTAAEPSSTPKPRTVEALTFKVAKPTDIATYLSARFPELKVTPSGEKDATYLLIEGDAETVERARAAAYAFEQQLTGSVEIVTEVYRVKYADSRDLARIVSQLVPGVTVSLGPDALLSRGGAGGSGGAGGQQGADDGRRGAQRNRTADGRADARRRDGSKPSRATAQPARAGRHRPRGAARPRTPAQGGCQAAASHHRGEGAGCLRRQSQVAGT
jgi:hypothetical protein